MGGVLSKPTSKYPSVFGGSSLFQEFPFLLPNLVASVLSLCGLCFGWLYIKETLASKRNERDYGRVLGRAITRGLQKAWSRMKEPWKKDDMSDKRSSSPLLGHSRISSASTVRDEEDGAHDTATKVPTLPPPAYREVFTYQSNLNLLVYTLLALHSIAYDQLLPIFMHYPRQIDRLNNPDVQLPFRFTGGMSLELHFFPQSLR